VVEPDEKIQDANVSYHNRWILLFDQHLNGYSMFWVILVVPIVSFLHLTRKLNELPKFVVVANAHIAKTYKITN
jgi:hypothetical protein